jgi:hypothetical protein
MVTRVSLVVWPLAGWLFAVALSGEARGQMPTIPPLGYSSYVRVAPFYQHCHHARSTLPQYQFLAARAAALQQQHQQQQQQHAAFQNKRQQQSATFAQQREQEAQHRQEIRSALPKPQVSDEQQADARFQAARLLWQGGNVAAARKWMEEIEASYPNTPAAARAANVLAQ